MENDKTHSWFCLAIMTGWIVVMISFVLIRENQEDSIPPMLVTNTETRTSVSKSNAAVYVTELPQLSRDSKQSSGDSSMDYRILEDRIVERLLHGYGPEKDKYIIHSPMYNNGFTNSFRSLIGSVVVAIATGRRLRIDWKDLFIMTDSSFKKLMFTSNENIPKPGMTISNVKPLLSTYKRSSLSQLLNHKVTKVCSISDISFLALHRPIYDEILKEVGLFSLRNDPHFLLSQLLLQPNKELKSVIERLQNNCNLTHCVGIHLRMGGKIANSHDRRFLKVKTVEKVLKEINMKYDNRTIFLSTDSPNLVPRIKTLLKNHPVATTDVYEVGHSRRYTYNTTKYYQFLKRAIVDAWTTSRCDPLYTTYYSSYSILIYWLSNNSKQYTISDKGLISS